MIEPRSQSVRSEGRMKLLHAGIAGAAAVAALIAGWLLIRSQAHEVPPSRAAQNALAPVPTAPKIPVAVVTARLAEPKFTPWPPKPEVIGPPAGPAVAPRLPRSAKVEAPRSNASPYEPAAPSREDLTNEAQRTGDALTADDARGLLLDDRKSSALKLAVIDKLSAQDPSEVVPVLIAFLEHPGGPAAAYTKPTAIRVLAAFRDPLADQALAKLATTSSDERVRLTIAALVAQEKRK